MIDFVMPYLIQVMREYGEKINKLTEAEEKRKQAAFAPQPAVVPPPMDPAAVLMTGGFPPGAPIPPVPVGTNPILTNVVGVQPNIPAPNMLPPGVRAFPGAPAPGVAPGVVPGVMTNPGAGFPQPPFGM